MPLEVLLKCQHRSVEILFGSSAGRHGISDLDRQYMVQALQLARRGLGQTEPNPAVGCIIVKEGKVSRLLSRLIETNLEVMLLLEHCVLAWMVRMSFGTSRSRSTPALQ